MNKIFLIGRLTKDPELNKVNGDISVCRFSIAVSRKYANSDGTRETDFLNCVAWRGLADNIAKYCSKGSKVSVIGEVQNRSYDAEDGTKKYVTDIVLSDCEFLDSKKDTETDVVPVNDSDLPF